MSKSKSKYYITAVRMDEAFLELLAKKDFEYITVKEICEKAGVNRSTFYLHYETIGDLLSECVEYTNKKCFERYTGELENIKHKLADTDLRDLVFISPEYMTPYFEFVRENKHLFKIAISRPAALNAEKTFEKLFREIFSPILDRFHCADADKPYVIGFYISGLIAIVSEWIKGNCDDSIDKIILICMQCIIPNRKETLLSSLQEPSKGDKSR